MQTRNVSRFTQTRDEVRTKATGATVVTYSSSLGGRDRLTVISDVKNGDRKTVNPHEFYKRPFEDYHGNYIRESPTEVLSRTGVIGGFSNFQPAAPLLNNLYNEAIADMYEQLRSGDVGSGLDLSIDTLQARQVAKMTADVIKIDKYRKQIGLNDRYYKALARGNTRALAELWLEFQYGWKPLVQSIYGTFDALMHRQLTTLGTFTGRARQKTVSMNNYKDGFWPGSREVVVTRESYRCKVVCLFAIENNLAQRLSGYTSLNPASILWEMTRFSFVVDWVYDVGGYLKNLESGVLFRKGFKGGYVVYGYNVENSGQLYGYGGTVATSLHSGSGTAYNHDRWKRRSKLDLYPLPYPPQFKLQLGLQRLMSAASLLRTNMPR
jgi:hypothetical protein